MRVYTLDGKETFHSTQYCAWQRGPSTASILHDVHPSSTTLHVPECVSAIIPSKLPNKISEPVFSSPFQLEWLDGTLQETQQLK